MRLLKWFVLFLSLVLASCVSFTVIQPNEVGVNINWWSGELGEPLQPGARLIPWTNSVTIYNTQSQAITFAGEDEPFSTITARTLDGQEVHVDLVVNFHIDPINVNRLHIRWQNSYLMSFVRPIVRGVVRNTVALYDAPAIYGNERANLETDIRTELETRLTEEGLILDEVHIRDLIFSE